MPPFIVRIVALGWVRLEGPNWWKGPWQGEISTPTGPTCLLGAIGVGICFLKLLTEHYFLGLDRDPSTLKIYPCLSLMSLGASLALRADDRTINSAIEVGITNQLLPVVGTCP